MPRSWGPGIFPQNAREGDADEQPRGGVGGGDRRQGRVRRYEGPLVNGYPTLGCRDKSGGCRALKPELGHWLLPSLPPQRAECPVVHRAFWSNVPCAALPSWPLRTQGQKPKHMHLSPGVPGLVPAPRKPTRNAIIVVVILISLKRKPAPRDGMTQTRSHDASGRAGTGTLGSWVHSLAHTPGCCPSLPFPPPYTHFSLL